MAVAMALAPNTREVLSVVCEVGNNAHIYGYFYVPNGTISMGNNESLNGAIVAKSVNIQENDTFDDITNRRPGLPTQVSPGGLYVTTWKVTNQ